MRNSLRRIFRLLPTRAQTALREARNRLPLTSVERWVRNEYMPFAMSERQRVFLSIARFQHINRPMTGYYMEFGCHEANTMRMAWDTFRYLFDFDYLAFDSFQGLPEISDIDRQDIWAAGKLCTEEHTFLATCIEHGMTRARLTTVKGFYDQTLTGKLREQLGEKKAAVVYVDCDLYQSTVPVLEFVKDFLQRGTVIVFDDWNCFWADPEKGERRAWSEFCARYPELRFEEFVTTSMQKSFVYVGMRAATELSSTF